MGRGMIVELGVGLIAIGMVGVVGYVIYCHRGQMRWARMREEQMKGLKRLKRKIEREK